MLSGAGQAPVELDQRGSPSLVDQADMSVLDHHVGWRALSVFDGALQERVVVGREYDWCSYRCERTMNLSGFGDMPEQVGDVLEQGGPTFRIRIPLSKVEHIRIRHDPELGGERSRSYL
jgi:hypothetical protein